MQRTAHLPQALQWEQSWLEEAVNQLVQGMPQVLLPPRPLDLLPDPQLAPPLDVLLQTHQQLSTLPDWQALVHHQLGKRVLLSACHKPLQQVQQRQLCTLAHPHLELRAGLQATLASRAAAQSWLALAHLQLGLKALLPAMLPRPAAVPVLQLRAPLLRLLRQWDWQLARLWAALALLLMIVLQAVLLLQLLQGLQRESSLLLVAEHELLVGTLGILLAAGLRPARSLLRDLLQAALSQLTCCESCGALQQHRGCQSRPQTQ